MSAHSLTSMRLQRLGCEPGSDRGVATLTVVMVLFFIVSMVAAYTSRNLIFEQRTSANQYRSTQALEVADAGLNWALALLNGGRIDPACAASADPAHDTFRERYLSIDPDTGMVLPRLIPAAVPPAPLMAGCVFNGAGWTCSCPSAGLPVVATPPGSGVFPAFRVRFETNAAKPGLVTIKVNGCTRNADACLGFPPTGETNEGRVTVTALVALKGGVTTLPAAPVTAKGNIDLGAAALTAINSNPLDSGITVHAGRLINPGSLKLVAAPGSPPSQSILENDLSLDTLDSDRMFSNAFGMSRTTYRDQPGAVKLSCGGTCSAATVRTAIANNPGRVLWLDGALDVNSAGDIGSAAAPVVIVVNGNVTFSSDVNIYGLVYTATADWVTSGTSTIRGAVMAQGNLGGNSTATVVYDRDVLRRLRLLSGSFVVVPGSWRDF